MKVLHLTPKFFGAYGFGLGKVVQNLVRFGLGEARDPKREFIDYKDYDVIHVHDYFYSNQALWAKRRLGKPVVFDVHLPRSNWWAERRLAREADVTLVHSNWASRLVLPYKPRKLVIIPCGVEPEWVKDPRDPHFKDKVAIFWGRHVYQKGLDVLLHAWKSIQGQVPDARLYIAGTSGVTQSYRNLARRLGLRNVFWLGYVERDQLVEIANKCYLHVVPSRYEPFGIVALEGIAVGLPIVASRAGGLEEIVEASRGGLLVPPNPRKLAEAMGELFADPSLAYKLAKWGNSWVRNYTWDKLVPLYKSLYEMVLGGEKEKGVVISI